MKLDIFHTFIGHLYFSSFVNCQFMAHTHFSISLFVFSLSFHKNSLYTKKSSFLSVISLQSLPFYFLWWPFIFRSFKVYVNGIISDALWNYLWHVFLMIWGKMHLYVHIITLDPYPWRVRCADIRYTEYRKAGNEVTHILSYRI